MRSDFITNNLFRDLSGYDFVYPWERFVLSLRQHLAEVASVTTSMIGTSKVMNSILDPSVSIGDFSLIRNSIIEAGVKIGAHVQVNMSIIRRGTELPHFNNVGYSFLGDNVLFGAGATTSSRRLDGKFPFVLLPNSELIVSATETFGALIGDRCKVGSHARINPFTVISKDHIVYPGKSVSGFISDRYNSAKAKVDQKL